MPLQELLKLRDKLGKDYSDAVFSNSSSNKKGNLKFKNKLPVKRTRRNHQSDSDEPPEEVSSKKPLPLWGMRNYSSNKKIKQETRDPRFDSRAGTYKEEKFRTNFEFAFNMRQEELASLKKELKDPELDPDRKSQIKFLIQRIENQNRSYEQNKAREEKFWKKKEEIQKARKEGRKPFIKSKRVERTEELVQKFEELKKSGQLAKHIEKRKKKNASKNRKKLDIS